MYESGLAVAFLLWLWQAIIILISINSRMERNLNKIGMRVSWTSLKPKERTAQDAASGTTSKTAKYLFIVSCMLVLALTSWAYVLLHLGAAIYRWTKNYGEPQAMREFSWKLKNTDMTFEQIVRSLMTATEQDPTQYEQVKADIIEGMNFRGLI